MLAFPGTPINKADTVLVSMEQAAPEGTTKRRLKKKTKDERRWCGYSYRVRLFPPEWSQFSWLRWYGKNETSLLIVVVVVIVYRHCRRPRPCPHLRPFPHRRRYVAIFGSCACSCYCYCSCSRSRSRFRYGLAHGDSCGSSHLLIVAERST